ncbi:MULTISPECIES: MBL fold metallo-hydrolase [Halorussus]|uniref:MBL fold metallo-hydrolase n=1 Tax=Halorussus TaxID=1070314 RepID=UPI00209FA996|nr:MBL fold metallo-hydrolase [Halorussus vallis]USZ75181.1 MBL fold metallo-hydrolase [Halorussus vallis]
MTDVAEESSITSDELHERIAAGERVTLLDLRNRKEFESWRVEGESVERVHVPYAKFAAAKARGEVGDFAADLDLEEPVVVVCARGETSAAVADALRETGLDARNLSDGMAGWARVYVSRELPTTGVTVRQYDRPATGCLSYLVVSDGQAVVVDPLRAFVRRYVEDAAELDAELVFAVDTHVHADHLSGVRALAAEGDGVEAVLPAGARDRGLAFDAHLLDDGEELEVGDAVLRAVHAPGHTTELTALRLLADDAAPTTDREDQPVDLLFSGDALFAESFGRPDLESGEEGAADLAAAQFETLRTRLLSLPGETLLAPGHRTPTAEPAADGTFTARLEEVRAALALPDDREAFVERVLESLPPRPANYERIVPANLGREDADDETAFEWELGPNNCAVDAAD